MINSFICMTLARRWCRLPGSRRGILRLLLLRLWLRVCCRIFVSYVLGPPFSWVRTLRNLFVIKNAPGLLPRAKISFRGTTCIQSSALHFVSTDILCSCNVELTLMPTGHRCEICVIECSMLLGSLLKGYFYNSFTKPMHTQEQQAKSAYAL